MDRYWKSIIHPIIKLIQAKHIIEIGSDEGRNTKNILDYCTKYNACLTSIDPSPNFSIEQFKLKYTVNFNFIKSLSLEALPKLDTYDAILIDGDHNWYTVYNELKVIEKNFKDGTSFPLIFLHEVNWPYARRDRYYNPKTIPKEYIQYYEKLGIDPQEETLVKDRGLNSDFFNAYFSNTPKNGVLTAIEDFICESNFEFTFMKIPLFNGLGILFIKNLELEKKINEIISNSNLFQLIENELIETQISLNNAQSAKNSYIAENNRLLKEKESQTQQIDSLQQEKETQYRELLDITSKNISNDLMIKDIENETRSLNSENQQLKNELKESKINVHTLTSQKNLIYSENKYNIAQLQKTKADNQRHIKEINILKNKLKLSNSQKNNILSKLNKEKKKNQNEIKNLETKLQISNSQKNIILNELNNDKNKIQDLSVTYQNLEKENNNLKTEIETKNSKFSELLSINNNQQEEIIELQDTINNYIAKIEEYELSTSWKITKPLRIISNKLNFKRKNK